MKSKSFLSFLFLGTSVIYTPSLLAQDLAEPAFRSPVVAVEFTGQRCRYCPNLARALKANQELYGAENYIITALHSLSSFSTLPGNHVSLYHPEAQEYAASIDVHDGLPQLAYNTLGPKVSNLELKDMYKQDDVLECTGNVYYNNEKKYVIDIQTRLRRNQQELLKDKKIDILFWTLENDVVALQDDNGKFVLAAHQHIFRGSVNSTWGEPYEIGTRYTSSWDVPASVTEVSNTEIVVFFLDHETRTILDAGQFKVKRQTSTGIDKVSGEEKTATTATFDVSGRPLQHPVKRGFYIQNGNKYFSK